MLGGFPVAVTLTRHSLRLGCARPIEGGRVMPKPWDRKRIVELIEMMQELLEAADLDDDEADEVCEILLPKLRQRSGLDVSAFRAAVCAALPSSGLAAFSLRH